MTLPTAIVVKPELDITHQRIHEGNFFSTHTITTGLLIANPKLFLFDSAPLAPSPPETIKIHLIFIVSANPGVRIEFFEDTVITDHGSTLTIINQDRNSTTTPVCSVFQDPTIISEGITVIFSTIIGSTTIGGTGGLVDRNEQEIILKIGTHYLLKITPLVNNTDITTHFAWYDARPSSPAQSANP